MLRKSTVLQYGKFIFYAALLTSSSAIFSGCKDTGGVVEGYVSTGINDGPGPTDSSKTWNLLSLADYTYDSNYIAFDGSGASLRLVNTAFNDETAFNRGTHVGTSYSGGALRLLRFSDNELAESWAPEWAHLIGYWKFDGNFSPAAGVLGSISTGSGTSFGVPAKVGANALIFSGSGDRSTASYTADFSMGWTSSAWLRPTALADMEAFRTSDAGATDVVHLRFMSTNQFRCGSSKTVVYVTQPVPSYSQVNTWTHVACVYSPTDGTLRLFVNGQLASSAMTATILDESTFLTRLSYSGNRWNGAIDEFSVWKTALNQTQINSIYSRQRHTYLAELSPSWTPRYGNLVGYWKMDGNWLDSSGNYAEGTPSGSPTFTTSKVGAFASAFASASSQIVSLGDITQLNNVSKFTIVAWCRFTALSSNQKCFSKFHSSVNRIGVGLSSPGYSGNDDINVILANTASSFSIGYTTSNVVKPGVWLHVAMVFDGTQSTDAGKLRFFVNGSEEPLTFVSAIPATTSASLAGRNLTVGEADSSQYLNGAIDDLAVFSTNLTSAEVSLIYNRQKQKYAGSYDSPILDMGAGGARWTSLTGVTTLPFLKEIPTINGSESTYSSSLNTLTTGLLGLWHLDEAAYSGVANEVVDASGNGKHGRLASSSVTNSAGLFGRGGDFTVSNPSIVVTSLPDLGPTFSYATWVKTASLTSYARFADRIAGTAPNIVGWQLMNYSTTGMPALRIDTATSTGGVQSQICQSNTLVSDDRWHLIVASVSGSTARIYVDGKAPVSCAITLGSVGLSGAADLRLAYQMLAKYDEVAYWNRALSDSEVLELYRRGANRVKYQVRSCIDSSCSCKSFSTAPAGSAADCDGDGIANASDTADAHAANWIGPDGTAATYFSELQNNTSVDASGNPTGNVKTTGLTLDWSGSFFTAAARPTANQYFQYRVYLESDDENNLCSGSPCMPEIKSISIGPTNRYYGGSPSVVNNTAQAFTTLKSMTRSDSGSCTTYQVSTDGGTTWKWWNGSAWATTVVGVAESNYLSDYSEARLGQLESGNFKFKAFLNTNTSGDFTSSCTLSSLGITYAP